MKANIIFCLCLCLFTASYSQEKALKIFNSELGKEVVFKDGQRVRLVTFDGDRLTGKLKFYDDEQIFVQYRNIPLSQIKKIKRHPLLISLLTTGVMAYHASVFTGVAVVIAIYAAEPAALLLLAPAAAFGYGAFKPPNFLKGYKANKNWSYEIIGVSE